MQLDRLLQLGTESTLCNKKAYIYHGTFAYHFVQDQVVKAGHFARYVGFLREGRRVLKFRTKLS